MIPRLPRHGTMDEPHETSTRGQKGAPPAVLLVDDHAANLVALDAVLEPLALRLVHASSGVQALELAERDDFAAIVLDVQMPGMDGFETAARIRQRDGTREVPIVFVTAIHRDELHVARGYAQGAVDYISKPFDPDVLRAKIDALVKLWQRAAAERARESARFERERAELLARERAARAEAEAQREALRFLAEASRVLAGSLDYQTTLAAVAQLAVPQIADWSAVDMLDEQGRVQCVAVAHVDPRRVALAHEMRRRWPVDMSAPHGVPQVLRTGRAEVFREIPDALLVASITDPELLAVVRELGFTSSMCVPLVVRGRPVGAITFVAAESGRRFGDADRALAEELALRASTAIEHATAFREAQEANRLKDEFVSTLSHELRTPLTAILGWTQLALRKLNDPAAVTRSLEIIERNANAQARIVDDVLDAQRIVTGKMRLSAEPVDLAGVIVNAVEVVRPMAQAKGVALEVTIEPELPAVVGDAGRLGQVCWNLLQNAVKFTPRGGRVALEARRGARVGGASPEADGTVRIEVRDTGQGIRPEILPFVFERFRQGDSSTTRAHGGLGLGLAIVRHIVELHGGGVTAESAGEGQGATFTLTLPVRARELADLVRGGYRGGGAAAGSAPPPAATPSQPAPPPVPATQPSPPPRLDEVRVLVVEDEPDARDLLVEVLASAGAQARAVSSVDEAIAAFDAEAPDVLVSDIGLPGEDGYSLVARLRARGSRVPAVALTAHARAEDRRRALDAGFDEHVAKPVLPDELVAAVADLVHVRG